MSSGKIKYVIKLVRNYSNWLYILLCRFVKKPIRKINLKTGISIIGGEKSLAIDIVDEVFIRKTYNPYFLQIKSGDTVVDIGANIGIFSLYAALNGATNIYSIEPLKENLRLIKQNFWINNLTCPILINIAISNKNGWSKLYLSDHDSHNLLFKRNNNRKFSKYRTVKTFKLSKFLEKYKVNKVDFLKIDCEGSEGDIFASTGQSEWKNIKKISIEYHNGVSILNDREISARLITLGYKVKTMKSDDYFGYIYAWR